MSDGAYAFPDLPLAPVDRGRTIVVEGAVIDGVREVLLRAADPGDGEGAILISTNSAGDRLLEHRRDAGGAAASEERICVVDCVSLQQGREIDAPNVDGVSNPGDLTGIGMRTTSFYERLRSGGIDRVRVGLLSVSTLLMYADLRRASRFVHVLTGRVSSSNGLGLLALDREAHDDQAVGTIQQLCDGRIEIRDGETGLEIRVSGLPDQPDGWAPIDRD